MAVFRIGFGRLKLRMALRKQEGTKPYFVYSGSESCSRLQGSAVFELRKRTLVFLFALFPTHHHSPFLKVCKIWRPPKHLHRYWSSLKRQRRNEGEHDHVALKRRKRSAPTDRPSTGRPKSTHLHRNHSISSQRFQGRGSSRDMHPFCPALLHGP